MERNMSTRGVPIGPDGRKDSIEITTAMWLDNNLQTLEHVDIRVWINHPRRGDVMVDLVSPNGIKSVLTETRVDYHDEAKTGFSGWRFIIKHWYVLYTTWRYSSVFKSGPLKSLKRISQRTVPSWDGTWFSGVLPLMLPKLRSSGHQWSMTFYPRPMSHLALYSMTPT